MLAGDEVEDRGECLVLRPAAETRQKDHLMAGTVYFAKMQRLIMASKDISTGRPHF
jgi:hypothetical protein